MPWYAIALLRIAIRAALPDIERFVGPELQDIFVGVMQAIQAHPNPTDAVNQVQNHMNSLVLTPTPPVASPPDTKGLGD